MNNKYFVRTVLALFLGLFLQVGNNTFAQDQKTLKGTQISDNTAPNTLSPLEFSLLELNSTERGFLMPRMTTAERDNIPTANLTAGLTIYNTTMGCVEFYNVTRQVWMNLCGDVEPAIFTIPNDKCGQIEKNITGDYIQGVLLDSRKNLISVEVSVSSPGTFDIEAVAYDDTGKENGYTFTSKGVFPTSGNFLLVLKGSGTPKKGYANANTKDEIRFTLNKKLSTCIAYNHVKPDFEPLVAAFDCTKPVGTEGKYKIDEPLTSANRLIASVKVTKPGRGKIYGEILASGEQKEVIKYESETIDFRLTDVGQVQNVILSPVYGTGKPTTAGELKGKLKLVSKGKNEYDPFAPEEIQTINGCDFKINVESTIAKISFSGNMEFESDMIGSGGYFMTPRTKMGSAGDRRFRMKVKVAVQTPGDFEIVTDTINGVYFRLTGNIPNTVTPGSIVPLVLIAYGESQSDQPPFTQRYVADITNFEQSKGLKSNSVNVEFVYQSMKMLSIGGQGWHPNGSYVAGDATWDGGRYLVSNPAFFAWNGVVRIDGLSMYGPQSYGDSRPKEPLDLMSNSGNDQLNSSLKDADMVFISGLYRNNTGIFTFVKEDKALLSLANYLKYSGGVVVYGEGGDGGYLTKLSSFLSDGGLVQATKKAPADAKKAAKFTSNSLGSRLIRGDGLYYFGKYGNVNLLGNNISGSNYGGEGVDTNISISLFGNYEALATYNSGGGVFAFRHTEFSFVGVGSSNFMGGRRALSGYTDGYPVRVDAKRSPATAPGTGGEVYNSWFVLNLIHWAIDEAQYNKTKNRQ